MTDQQTIPLKFTREEKLREIAREIELRRAVYGRQIKRGELQADVAARRIAIMLEIARDYGGHGDADTR